MPRLTKPAFIERSEHRLELRETMSEAKTTRSKVIPRIVGGLGNQLFVYAAARRLAIAGNAELVIDDVSGFIRDYAYQRRYQLDRFHISSRKASPAERLEPFSRLRRYVSRRYNQRLPFEERTYIQQDGLDFDPRLLRIRPRRTLYLEGYWQSEGYFKDVERVIRSDLRIRPPTDGINDAMAAKIRKGESVAVHVRFFDEPEVRTNGLNNAPLDYYARAIATMETLTDAAHYFVFSDRPSAARARLPLPDERITLVAHNQGDENAYADLWLMTQCRHFIIANSTFSWWGAWLAGHQGKRVIAPGFGKLDGGMQWGFEGLLPEDWIKV